MLFDSPYDQITTAIRIRLELDQVKWSGALVTAALAYLDVLDMVLGCGNWMSGSRRGGK